MQNKYSEFHLKEVFFILSQSSRLTGFHELAEDLRGHDINCKVMLTDEEYPVKEKALYITDSGAILQGLAQRNLPVAVYLHEGNRQESLGAARYAFEEPQSLDARYAERVFRRYMDIPWDILETERCFLRETVPDDVDAFYEIYNEPDMTRYTEDLYESKISERGYIREYIDKVYHYFEFGIWTVIFKETGEIIGRAGLNVREGYNMPELGYVIGKPWQGKGIATEVCRSILEYAGSEFGFDKVMTLIQQENIASLQVAKKLGFQVRDGLVEKGVKHLLMIWEEKGEGGSLPEMGEEDVYSK